MNRHPATFPRRLYPIFLIIVVAWVANFLRFAEFGFYEDDWNYWASAYSAPPSAWFAQLKYEVVHFFVGRPLQEVFMYAAGYAGARCSSIGMLYLVTSAILVLNAVLMYLLLRRRFPILFSCIAVLMFVLTPLTTVKQLVNMGLSIGPSFTFLLGALLLYRRRPVLSALVASLTLVTYESMFFIYLAAPLFQRGRFSTRRLRAVGIHLLVCMGLAAAYVLARRHFAEERIAEVSLGSLATLKMLIEYCLFYVASSFRSYLYAFDVGLREIGWEAPLYSLLFLIPALFGLFRLFPVADGGFAAARRTWWIRRGVFFGLVLTLLGYALAYFFMKEADWVFALAGRDTRFSAAASMGSSILLTATLFALFSKHRLLLKTVIAGFLVVLLAYSFVVQQDYANAWTEQKKFLTQLVMLSPDVERDTVFIVRAPAWRPEVVFPRFGRRPSIGLQRHGLQRSLRALLTWSDSPRIVFEYQDTWKDQLELHPDGRLYWKPSGLPGGWSASDSQTPGRIITLTEQENGSLVRVNTPISVDGRQIVRMLDTVPRLSNWRLLPESPLFTEILPDFVRSAVMTNAPELPWGPLARIEGALTLESAELAYSEASIERGRPLKIITAAQQGAYAASFPIRMPQQPTGAAFLFLRARVLRGEIGFGVLDRSQKSFQFERSMSPAPEMTNVYMPLHELQTAGPLIIRNQKAGERSEIWIEDIALLSTSGR